jgi:hypothetical protein
MLFSVTVEPKTALAATPQVRLTVEAPSKDAALESVETRYRRMYPTAGTVTLRVKRVPDQ